MYQSTPLLTLSTDWQTAIAWAIAQLDRAGLQVRRSFDLLAARAAHLDCSCPYHGTELCDCQMVVLLVYDQRNPPATLVAHSRDGRTQLALVEVPQQRLDPMLQAAIRHALDYKDFMVQDHETPLNIA